LVLLNKFSGENLVGEKKAKRGGKKGSRGTEKRGGRGETEEGGTIGTLHSSPHPERSSWVRIRELKKKTAGRRTNW